MQKTIIVTVNACWNLLQFRKNLLQALLDDGHRVIALAPFDHATEELRAMGLEVVDLPMDSKGMSPLRDLKLLWEFSKAFRLLKPDLILSFTIKNNIYGALAAKAQKIPFVPNITGLGTAFLSGSFLAGVARYLYRRAFAEVPAVYFQNADDAGEFLAKGLVRRDQVRHVPGSGIDISLFQPSDLPKGPPVFLQVGRLLTDKGVREFAEAAKIVKEVHPEAAFQLLGGFAHSNSSALPRHELEAWVETDIIDYLGETSDVVPFIQKASVVVLASYREGLPRTLLEGAALGRPLIATDVPGCRSVVDQGKNGFLADVKSGASLADAMIKMIQAGPETRAKMGKAARKTAEERFDVSLVIETYRKDIEALI